MQLRLTILLLIVSTLCYGQGQDAEDYNIKTDTATIKNFSFLAVPIAFYTPETSFGFGGGTQIFFKSKKSTISSQISNVFGTVIYTLNKQLIVQAQSKIFFDDDNYVLDSDIKYQIYPNVFWGIGYNTPDSNAENYNQTETAITVSLLKQLPPFINFGFQFSYSNYIMTEVQTEGILASDTIEGSSGAKLIGLGVVLNFDTRDNYFSPLVGGLYQFKTNFTSKAMGSTHTFNTYHLDLRKFIKLPRKQVLAMQFYTRLTFGNAPFQAQSYYGGANLARGYFRGRYIDQNLYVVQVEYRLPVFKRWEVAAFALTGNVGRSNQSLFNDFKSSIGFGPRYFISKNNRSLLRLDIGFNSKGGTGIYFGVNEAF